MRLKRFSHCLSHTDLFVAAGAVAEGNDLSLFFGDKKSLNSVRDECRFLSKEIYGQVVLDTVVCCVDILAVRTNSTTGKKECLLVERASEPAKGYWWPPGGRLLKGETFFDAAERKAREETGLSDVKPVQVLGVWNTFFPTSNWDTSDTKGTQTVNPIVLVELGGVAEVSLDETSENFKWIPLDYEQAVANGENSYVLEGLARLNAWDPSYASRR